MKQDLVLMSFASFVLMWSAPVVLTKTENDGDSASHVESWRYHILHYDIMTYSLNDVMTTHGDKCLQTVLFYE